jgi:branched-chain amino acid aminotransferase
MTTVWLNGSLVPEEQARLSPFDHGVLVGDGVFETMKVVGGLAFAMGRHLARLRRSGAALALAIPV